MKAVIRHRLKEEDFTLKEKILYALGGIIVIGGTIYIGQRLVKKGIANREEKKSFDEGSTATVAKQIKMAFENDGWPGSNTPELRRILREVSSKEEMKKVSKSYQKLYNSNLFKDMSDELQSTEYNEMLSIIAAKPERKGQQAVLDYKAWAKRMKSAFEKSYGFLPGTDEDAITAVFVEIPTQAAFVEVGKAYWGLYNTNLLEDLKGELEFWEYAEYMKIITSKPKS